MDRFLQRIWYGTRVHPLLLPLSRLYALLLALRRSMSRRGVRLPVPVIVVGNLAVGGTGKTPVVAWLAGKLAEAGLRTGIVSRGYGGRARGVVHVGPDTDPAVAGDEPVLLARRTGLPVVVGRDRVAAARALLEHAGVDVIVSDDGLQHYRLARDFEIVVVDAQRGLGNGALLPAGPLREPASRLDRVDMVLANGGPWRDALAFTLRGDEARGLADDAGRPLESFAGETVHAVAGIGNPQRFFDLLSAAGMRVIPHPFPDHHRFGPGDIAFPDALPVLMTEKDAVKCRAFADRRTWYVPVEVSIDPAVLDRILTRLRGD